MRTKVLRVDAVDMKKVETWDAGSYLLSVAFVRFRYSTQQAATTKFTPGGHKGLGAGSASDSDHSSLHGFS